MTSAAPTARSVPLDSATPTCAAASAEASLIPSPTNSGFRPAAFAASTAARLSSGSSPARVRGQAERAARLGRCRRSAPRPATRGGGMRERLRASSRGVARPAPRPRRVRRRVRRRRGGRSGLEAARTSARSPRVVAAKTRIRSTLACRSESCAARRRHLRFCLHAAAGDRPQCHACADLRRANARQLRERPRDGVVAPLLHELPASRAVRARSSPVAVVTMSSSAKLSSVSVPVLSSMTRSTSASRSTASPDRTIRPRSASRLQRRPDHDGRGQADHARARDEQHRHRVEEPGFPAGVDGPITRTSQAR